LDNDDKKLEIDVSWTLNDCEWTTGPAWQKFELDSNSDYNTDFTYTSPALEISSVPDLFADFDDEILRDKYPELMAAWQQYQNLLAKYRMWDNVTNPPEDPPF
jgi:hypothetical protein